MIKTRRSIPALLFLLFLTSFSLRAQYRVETVPDPKIAGQDYFVSDPNGILGAAATLELNQICAALQQGTSAEIAIVAIDDFEGGSDFEFAHRLFNYWGIGKEPNNNGLLLFIAKNRHRYQFVTGYGMEGRLPDLTLHEIGEKLLVPRFKQNDYGGGVLEAMRAIDRILRDPAQLEYLRAAPAARSWWQRHNALLWSLALMLLYILVYLRMRRIIRQMHLTKSNTGFYILLFLVVILSFFVFIFLLVSNQQLIRQAFRAHNLPWWIFILGGGLLLLRYASGRKELISHSKDAVNRVIKLKEYDRRMLPALLLSPLCLLGLIGRYKHLKTRNRRMKAPDETGKWKRINKDRRGGIRRYLNDQQQREEKYQSMSYEAWVHSETGEVKLIPFRGAAYRKYLDCPGCHCHSLSKAYVKTLQRPTYTRSGLGERVQTCFICQYEQSLGTVFLAKKVKSSSSGSSSSGSSWSSSGSSSSSSSGSWGGGSSGGGGAGGSW